ncbi:MAG: 8-amino-7-oxononanoate synthase [Chthoniobacterales bacterium]|nr:8-amino-7-oxononanoate synthase [Chthoniobacterales bacterium]
MSELFEEQLEALHARSLHRKLREIGTAQGPAVRIVGRELINFSSNDYLGLAADPILRQAAIAAIAEFGVGAGASRLISGTQSPHVQLESTLAKWKGAPAAICFSSGYAAALGALPALASKQDVVILDKLCHASLIDGTRLSGATLRVFPHNHLGKLESHLEWARREHPDARVVIATESVFSMDGDRAPLQELVELKNRFEATLLIDEAHAVGVIGPHGRGLAAELGLEGEIEVQMGTLSKSLGVSGGYICGSRNLIDWLINRARSFIFSTAPPPALAAAATAAIRFLNSEEGDARRKLLWRRIVQFRKLLPDGGAAFGKPSAAIIPWMVGDERRALDLARALQQENFLVPAIRYPTVAKGAARLRITISAAHSALQIASLGEALGRLAKQATGARQEERPRLPGG